MPRTDLFSAGATDTVVASAARTTSGDSGVLTGYAASRTLLCQLDVTAPSGSTPTLDVVVEDTLDGTNFNTVGSFAQKVTTGREVVNVTNPFSDRLRVRWTVGGSTPSFTFSVVVYAEP